MNPINQPEDVSPPTAVSTGKSRSSRVGHWLRVTVMIMSGGFIFPHAMTEDMDSAKHEADKDAQGKKH